MVNNGHNELIDALARQLGPVRRLRPPGAGSALWLATLLGIGGAVYAIIGGNVTPMGAGAYAWGAMATALVTAALGSLAAFELSFPDRKDRWLILPLPAVAAWLVLLALSGTAVPSAPPPWGRSWDEVRQCLVVIAGSGVLLSLTLLAILRGTPAYRRWAVAITGGFSAAAAAFAILMAIHPHNSSLLDLGVHVAAVIAVVGFHAAGMSVLRSVHRRRSSRRTSVPS